ncbi:aldo/keto reductase [Melioribacteraceae bacterium 4301-Me]|uniref:aldo/keto reductase n=1 Tax=Pyranulibacter aquaticus TaxID=3163344 RepID=UPI0035958C04
MLKRKLGKNGPELTVIGFGAWAIGGPWKWGWGKVDDNESIEAIRTALDNEINWIDTAAVYGLGHSEEVVAEAIKDRRKEVFVATKCGMVPDGKGGANINNHPNSIRKEIEDSLRRLQTDYVDLYQIHWPDPNVPVEDSWGEMVKIKQEGKARFIGVCNFDVNLLERCMKIEHVQSLQPPFSMLRRDVAKEILPYCEKNGIGVVAYSPMQAGLLTGNFHTKKLAEDDWRKNNPYFQEPYLSKALELVERLRPIAAKADKTVGNLAVAWVLSHSAITSAIVGARNKNQVLENIKAAEYVLTKEDLSEIEKLLKEFEL